MDKKMKTSMKLIFKHSIAWNVELLQICEKHKSS